MASAELSIPNTGSAVSRVSVSRRRLAIPRLHTRDAILVYFLVISVAVRFWLSTDPDYWWHLRAGEMIVKDLAVPMRDPFSFTVAGGKWIDHEWLSQVIMYGLAQTVGYGGSVLIFALFGAASVLIMGKLLRQLSVPEPIYLGLIAGGIALTYGFWALRPNVFSLLLTAVFLASTFRFVRHRSASLWHLPPLMLLWANLHGGYVVGLGVLGLVVLSEGWRWRQGEGSRVAHVALVAGLSFIATGVNPYTYHLWLYPFTYFFGDNASLDFIAEWQSPRFFHTFFTYPLGLAILGLIVLSAMSKKPDLWRMALAVVFTGLAMQSIRHQSLFGLMIMPVFGELLLTAWPGIPAMPRRAESTYLGLVNFLVVGCLILGGSLLVLTSSEQSHREPSTHVGHLYYPAEGAAFVKRNFPQARMLNEYSYGGYLVYALKGDPPVFIDGRLDVYGRAILTDYTWITEVRPGWRNLLDRYQIDVVLFPTHSALGKALFLDEGWNEAFRGKQESVFVRAVPTTAP